MEALSAIPVYVVGSLGWILNPVLLVLAYMAAKYTPKEPRFWLFFAVGIVGGFFFQVIFAMFSFGGMGRGTMGRLIFLMPFAMMWATLLFLAIRKPWRKTAIEDDEFVG